MEYKQTLTRVLSKEQNSLLWEMSLESARAYNHYLKLFDKHKEFKACNALIEKEVKRKYLQAHSFDASYQQAQVSIKSFFRAMKDWGINKHKYTSKPQFPVADKKLQVLIFKKDAIRCKDGYLLLSTGFRDNPIRVKWNSDLGLPHFATINMQYGKWCLSTLFKKESENLITGSKTLAIDLGIKRIATTFDGSKVETYNGKDIMALSQLENKKRAYQSAIRAKRKEQNRRKHSRANKRKIKGIQRQITKIQNKKRDILHKYSRYIVNKAVEEGVSKIIVGDCRSIHTNTNLGKVNNQKVQQGQEQKLYTMVDYKFERVGGQTELVNESYSTQDCPMSCGNRHKPKDRTYRCKCGFTYDRDGVGAINIYASKVSFALSKCSGGLTPPRGVKYHPQLSRKMSCGEDRSSVDSKL